MEVERVGSGAMDGSSVRSVDIGYMPYAEVVVRTIRTERRGLVRARKAAILRRREVVGRAEEKDESCADASGGITCSVELFPVASSFNLFLRL